MMFDRNKHMFSSDTGSDTGSDGSDERRGPVWPTLPPPTSLASEPLAIVGIGCRLPGGVEDWPSFWQLLDEGRDAITETPADRWSTEKFYREGKATPGKLMSRWGGHVTDITAFDPQAFGISPREAAMMDPQQRMLLEVAFRAIEDAGTAPSRLAGENVAVYIGISSFDHAVSSLSLQDRGVISPYSNTGGSSSIAANRISYCFDLRGPSMAIDTACSSSLIAVHLACEAIRRGECTMALAGGVNALLMPDFTIAFSQLGVLSPDGRCKTFDARANGYVRSEGAGMVLIRPLRDALAAGDLIHAVIRSTATNQDGRTPGLTVPSGDAQEALIREACRRGGVQPSELGYVEAHGTGTSVGDPIEANAIGRVVGKGRAAGAPCLIGSVKTNIGHLEAAAGITSLIKVALSLSHRRIPAHLHFQSANPAINFAELGLEVPTTARDWTVPAAVKGVTRRRLAGINGFGYGGANAHVILEEPPALTAPAGAERASEWVNEPTLVPLAARSGKALKAAASSLAAWLDGAGAALPLSDIAASLAYRRSTADSRGAVLAKDSADLAVQLRALADAPQSGSRPHALEPGQLAFAFSGQGPQWWGMGRRLFATSGVFRRVIERCGAEFSRYGSWSLVEEMLRDEASSRLKQTRFAQPAIFAIQVGIAAVWKHWGIEPAACVGHSVGEIAAAHVAGALSFEQACRVAFHRGRTMDLATSHGAMIAVGLSRSELADWVSPADTSIEIAAVNGPTSLTLSGPASAIEPLAQRLSTAGVFCRQLTVEYAFHSQLMDPARDELMASLSGLTPSRTQVPLYSTVTGGLIDGKALGAEYWWQNVRQPVLFADAMASLATTGIRAALEVGPHPVLSFAINECFQSYGAAIDVVPSLHREQDDVETMLGSLGRLYCLGLPIDWSRLHRKPQHRLPLPPEPFLRRPLLEESREARESRRSHGLHPLLGERADSPTPRWECRVDLRLQAYLEDHRARGACVHPAAAFLEAACAAARQLADTPDTAVRLRRLVLRQACIHDPATPRWMECRYTPGRQTLDFAHRGVDDNEWAELASVTLATETGLLHPLSTDLDAARGRCREVFDAQRLYTYCHELGLDYGETFRGMLHGCRRSGECVAQVQLPPAASADAKDYLLHPAFLDACFHGMIAADRDFDHTISGLYLPHEIAEMHVLTSPGTSATVHVVITDRTDERILADLDVYDAEGRLCVAVRGFASHRVAGSGSSETTADLVYRLDWEQQAEPTASAGNPGTWLVFADHGGHAEQLAEHLAPHGEDCILVRHGNVYARNTDGSFTLAADDTDGFLALLGDVPHEHLRGVVYLWGLDAPATSTLTCSDLQASSWLTCRGPLHLVQAWEKAGPSHPLPCFFVTAAAQPLEGTPDEVAVAQGALVGMARVVASEYGRLRTRLIDLPATIAESLPALVGELHRADQEDEVLLRDGHRYVRRFHPHADRAACAVATATLPYQLTPTASAGVEDLRHQLRSHRPLAAGDIEIAVHAAGLNFSDVMKALDLYPGLPPGRPLLGSECSGVVSRVGPGVTEWNVGDEVMAVAPGAFGSHVTVSAVLVARKPANLTHEQAAAVPIAFLTAVHALHECARIRAGESVLVHAASGGVGLAAIQLIRRAGARVLATAGNDTKRQFVADRGADVVMDSRSLGFADEARQITGGVDVILNSLPGEAIPRGLEALAIGGRFLEIGKRDIYADASLGMYAFRNNIAFFGIDLDQLFKQQPERMGQLLRTLPERFESGELEPLPVTVHAADQAAAAFREMQQARHIGKIVIDYTHRPDTLAPADGGEASFHREGSYWVAGGLGGFGIEVAKWLAARGAGTVILGGRSHTVPPQMAAELATIESLGARVRLLPVDITQPDDVRQALTTIAAEEQPLKGIFHTAMVLEDKLLLDLDHATLDRVLWPKLLGGWNLHDASRQLSLDHFVLFSSLSSVFGHAGQANYAAANAALDGLAHHRRVQGLPATVVNWGHLGEVGYLAKRDELAARLERQGVLSFTVQQAMDCLAYALASRETQLSVLRMDWTRWRGLGITDRVPPKFAHLLRSTGGPADRDDSTATSPEALREASAADRQRLVEAIVRTKTASLLGVERDGLEVDRPLLELGLDSLMAVELRNWIESQTAVSLPMSAVMRSAGVRAVSERICDLLRDDTAGSEAADTEQAHDLPAADGVALPSTGGPAEFPMSAGQQGLWAAYRRNPHSAAYNVFLPTRIRSPLDLEALRSTMALVVARHATLRTTFSEAGGTLRQHVHPALPPEFTVLDATQMSIDTIRGQAMTDAQRPFDLEHGPLLRVSVYRRADDDWIVQATSHHIATDFWSLILLLGEIAAGYGQLATGRPVLLPDATNNYADFVARQQRLLTSDQARAHAEFWKEQLDGIPTVLDLPTDRPRPARFSGRARSAPLSVSADVSAKVSHLASQEGVTPSAVMLSVVQLLLGRLANRSSFLIGMPFSGRSEQRFENTVGFFVNMLPIPARLNGEASFRSLVRQTGQTLVAALEHEDYPLAAIVTDAGCRFDASRNPLFQVSCTFEKSHRRNEAGRAGFLLPDRAEAVEFAGLRQESFHVPHQACVHDLEFVFEQTDDGFRGMLHFASDLFEPAGIASLAQSLESLVAEAVSDPDKATASLRWPTAPPAVPEVSVPTTVSAVLEPVVAARPDATAVIFAGRQLTYRQFVDLAWQSREALVAAGVAPGSLLPVVGDRSEGVVATLATLLAGYAPVPIDTAFPALTLQHLIADTNPQGVVLASDAGRAFLAGSDLVAVDLAELPPATTSRRGLPETSPEDLAYCIFTSGSTGRPKGVLVEHAAIANLLTWRREAVKLSPKDCVLLTFSHQFDAAMGMALATLTAGATLLVASDAAAHDITHLIDDLIEHEISVLPTIPSVLQLLVRHPRFAECTSLRQIWCGGEAMPTDLPARVATIPGVTLWNFYGPTETAVEVAAWQVATEPTARARVPIGTPAAGAVLAVVDEHLQLLPDGVPGELVVAGPGLARGYLGRPELTAERFVALPENAGGLRVYRTGDRCRRLPDGCYEYLGRLDSQVKLRGYRVELGEIEACLSDHPSVASAAVTCIAEGTPEARLAAYVVATERSELSVDDLRRYVASRLPPYKQPATLQVVDALPHTASGKIDRSRLPAPVSSQPSAKPAAPPRTPLERHLVEAWQGALGLDSIGIHESFFDLGGTSLQAALQAAQLREDLGVDVPAMLFFELAEIAKIARRLAELHPTAIAARFSDASLAPLDRDADDIHPLLVPLRAEGDQTPLFMIHPPGGIVVCYAALARELAPGRPVFGIRSRGLHGDEPLPESLSAMAEEYVAAIKAAQPVGPYLIGGWSLGGVIASEVARQLLAGGDTIDRLLLLDSALPDASDDADRRAAAEYGLDVSLAELGDLPPEEQLPFLYDHARKLGLIEETAPDALVQQVLSELQRLFAHHARLCSQHEVTPLPVDTLLVRPQEVPFVTRDSVDRGWGRVVRTVEVRQVPGHHHSMVTPQHAAALAATVDAMLETVAVP